LKSQTELLAGRVKAGETIGEPSGLPIGTDPASARALADVCLALFNVNDFIYVK
jgi:CRP-like cAMP-binding protein